MRSWRKVLAGMAVGIIISAAVYAQQTSSGAKVLTEADYAEIQRLYARYSWALDSRADDGRAYANVFTEDGELVVGANRTVGRERLMAFGAGRAAAVQPRHFTSNIIISPSPEGARGSVYLLVVSQNETGESATVSTGTYDDILVKTAEGWRFKRREVVMGSLVPAGIQILSSLSSD